MENMPTQCQKCRAGLCLRKQVVNLALGFSEDMYCLGCLAADMGQEEGEILASAKAYILDRQCFAKSWKLYLTVDYCPQPDSCFPGLCFN